MNLFESLLALTFVAAALLKLSNRFGIPYPSTLALAGVGVAALPFAPTVEISPDLALALFIPPALFDIAYDTSPRELRRIWMPLLSLALVAVLLTTGVVAWMAWAMIGLPLAAAIVLGAIVAPPDAAAASAAMSQLGLPRRTMAELEGESLLNDASALLIFGAAMSFVQANGSSESGLTHLLVAAPGGIVFGLVAGIAYRYVRRWFAGTLSARTVVIRAALDSLASENGEAAQALRVEYRSKAKVAGNEAHPQGDTQSDRLRRRAIAAQREALLLLRRDEGVAEDVFYQLERELDCAELYATSLDDIAIKAS